ncbi:MAG: PKD domain-containing protein [Pedobacter sp.]|nr:MAG: PKD domain-containing protein [Pedobacter sp.]
MTKRLFLFAFLFLSICGKAHSTSVSELTINLLKSKFAEPTITASSNTICNGGTVILATTAVSGATYQWIKDGVDISTATSSTYSATNVGRYKVKVTIGGTSEESSEIELAMSMPITASFTSDATTNTCSSQEISFTNTSVGGVSYEWDFGDLASGVTNNKSTDQNPKHIFIGTTGNGIQTFPVKLTVKNADGCTVSYTGSVSTKQISDINLGGTNLEDYQGLPFFKQCASSASEFEFSNLSSTKAGNTFYKIEWGDGTANYESSTFSSILKHTYGVGVHKLKYSITNANGCISYKEYNVFVGSTPAGGIISPGNTNACTSGSLTFGISGTENNPLGTSYKITFSDGSAPVFFTHPAPPTVTHTFLKNSCGFTSLSYSNAFSASLEISNPCGSTGGVVAPIYVSDKPQSVLNITPIGTVCVGTTVTASSLGSKGTIVSTTGVCSQGKTVWKIFPATGWAIVSGNLGDDNGSTNSGLWSAGSAEIRIRFNNSDKYQIKLLTAGNTNCGYIDEKFEEICVNPTPTAKFVLDQSAGGCAPFNVKATNQSNTPLCGANTYQWTVSSSTSTCTPASSQPVYVNGTNSTSENPQFRFDNAGVYTIRLITKNSEGNCTSVAYQEQITVKQKPVVSLALISSICEGASINPIAAVQNCYSSSAETYDWEFIGATTTTSVLKSPTGIVYPNSGNYIVKVTVTNECGSTSATTSLTVVAKPIGGTTNGDRSSCGPATAGSIILSGSTGSAVRWESSSNGTSWSPINSTAGLLTYNYPTLNATTYYRAVLGNGGCGQEFSTISKITVNPMPAKPTTTATAITYCLNDVATPLTAIGTGLKWYTAAPNGSNFSSIAPTPSTATAATIVYYVTQTVNGCESLPETITIKVNPLISNNVIGADQNICLGSTPLMLTQSGTSLSGGSGSYTYQWQQSADGTTWTDIANNATANRYQPGSLNVDAYYRRIVKSQTCSSESNSVKISVQGTLSNFQISSIQTICSGSVPDKLVGETPIGGNGTFAYTWEKSTTSVAAGFTIIPGENGIDYQPQTLAQTTYYRRITKSGSCLATSTPVTITVNPIPVMQTVTNIITCASSTIPATTFQTTASSPNVSFTWTNDNVNIGLASSGNGNITSFTGTNTTKAPLIGNLMIMPTYTAGGQACIGIATPFKITVLPTIAATAIADLTVCAGTSIPATILNSDADAFAGSSVTYSWTVTGGSIGLSNGSGVQIPAFTAVNSTTLPITVSVSVLPSYEYQGKRCPGKATVYKITVNPAPVVNFSAPDQTICSSASSTAVTLSSMTPGASFTWNATPVIGIAGLVTSGTNIIPVQTLINTTNAPLTVTYQAVASTSGTAQCPGAVFNYKITVNPATSVIASETIKAICSNSKTAIALSSAVAGTVFNWSVSNNANITGAANGTGALIDQNLINISAEAQTVVYTITPKFSGNATGCDGAPITVTIMVKPSPKIQFSASDISICSGSSSPGISLTSTTIGAKISWTSIVPAGITGVTTTSGNLTIPSENLTNNTNAPLTIIYTAVGSTDDLNACNGNRFEYKVTVNPVSRITNTTLKQEVCSGTNSSLVVLTSNVSGATYSWTATTTSTDVSGFTTLGSGSIPVQNLINAGTTAGLIKYVITPRANGCIGLPITYEITVNPKPIFTSSGSATSICSNTLFSYLPTSSTSGVTFTWKRAAVNGISNNAASGSGIDAAGAISETLINTTVNPIEVTYLYELSLGGCVATTPYPVKVTVNPAPTALFGPFSQNGCAPFAINIKNLNSKTFANTYTVDFGDGSPVAVYTDERDINHVYENDTALPKTFKLKVKTKNDCGEIASIEYLIVVQPQSVFSKLVLQGNQRYGCAPFNIDFTTLNQSTGANVYTWDFGDGSPMQETHKLNEPLSHTYLTAGDYTITLTATNGCSTVKSQQTVTVYPNVSASFKVSKPAYCLSETVVFTNTSDSQFTTVWNFGDGTTSTDTNPTHTYTTSGTKTVVLTATKLYPDGSSCTTSATQLVEITPGPIASFNSNASILNCGPFKLIVTSTPANAANVEWDFGDPTSSDNTATGYNASHTYAVPGTYLVTAKAYSLQGCTAISTQTIRVTETPQPEFTFPNNLICGPNATIQFKNETIYGGTDIVSYKWYVNDVLAASTKDFTNTFNTPTSVLLPYVYKIKLAATNILGCVNTIEHSVQFNPLPQANFTIAIDKACVPFSPQITNTSLFADKFEWYVDGVLVSTDKNPQNIIFNTPDQVHDIKLIADNQYGCGSNSITKQATTYPNPTASFTVKQDISCNGVLDVEITNTSIGATTYTWDYGDGSAAYIGNATKHIYGKAGIYELKLTASNGFCSAVFSHNIKIADAPKAAFLTDVKSGCNQLTVVFQNLSVNSTTYLWDFGDGAFSTEKNPTHNYNFVKSPFTVKLTAKGAFGCEDQIVMLSYISVFAPPTATINISPSRTVKVPDYGFSFKAETEDNIVSYKWDFGDGKTSDKQNIDHNYADIGTYKIKLSLTNSSGCVNVIEDEVRVIGVPGYLYLPNAFEPAHAKPDMKIFKVTATGMSSYNLKVFNKWGQVIWQTNKLDQDGVPVEFWDGTMNGQPAPQGAYYWSADAKFINGTDWKGMKYEGKTASKTGVVHLIR